MGPARNSVAACSDARRALAASWTFCFLLLAVFVPSATRETRDSRKGKISSLPIARFLGVKSAGVSKRSVRRPVTVADSIQMTRVAGPPDVRHRYTGGVVSDFAVFSPDGKRFVIVVRKGNLEQNTMDYSMLLFATENVFETPTPKALVMFASSSYREAIRDVKWLDDNDTIVFLGEQPGQVSQLYSVQCTSGKIEQLTHEPGNIAGYGISTNGAKLVFGTQQPPGNLYDASTTRNGLVVTTESLQSLISGQVDSYCQQLFFMESGKAKTLSALTNATVCQDPLELFVSPDGRYAVVKTNVADVPGVWKQYEDAYLQNLLALELPKGSRTLFDRYELIDLGTGVSGILLDSPIGFTGAEVAWAPDSRSVVLTDVFLPLNIRDAAERKARKSKTFTVEVSVPNGEISKIGDRDLAFPTWDHSNEYLQLRPSRNSSGRSEVEWYHKQGLCWERVSVTLAGTAPALPQIVVEHDLNIPPRIVAVDSRSGRKATILDLNPQFGELAFGKVEDITWIGGAGRKVHGGLYLPPDYVPGHRYPLVIQTHGFDPHGFWMDGSFTTAFAAQPLAGQGIVVLQVPDDHGSLQTPEEAPQMMETYEKAIDYLDAKGLIDRSRVGIIGFSRTCFYVKYMLTHSKHHLAAAIVADGVDSGYFQYMVYAPEERGRIVTTDSDKLNGSPPIGKGLLLWLKRSPGFLLDKIETPMRLEAHGALDGAGVLEEWEWFAGLRRLGKPVELFYLPTGAHVLDRPWERMASQQGAVDWFCFWLKNEEDPDRTKVEQYVRWRKLRNLGDAKE